MTPFDKKFGADFLASVPSSPGVYRFLNRAGTCVYVGKAKDLRARLGQYRNAKRTRAHRKMRRIVKASSGLEVEVTATEAEALLLENTLIQTLRPRLNVDGAFTFLYPTIGIKRTEHHLHVAYSTQADDLKSHGFRVYGCYRNRRVSRAGFDALVSILTWLGHPEGAEEKVPYTTWRRFRQIAPTLDDELASLLLGKADTFLQSAILGLVDKPAARRDSAEVQASVKALKRFFDTEGFRLARLRASSGLDYIPHDVRDQAMINSKHPLQSE